MGDEKDTTNEAEDAEGHRVLRQQPAGQEDDTEGNAFQTGTQMYYDDAAGHAAPAGEADETKNDDAEGNRMRQVAPAGQGDEDDTEGNRMRQVAPAGQGDDDDTEGNRVLR
jgi:hypothetical protein